MATIKKFEDLEIWQEARILANDIFSIVKSANNTVEYSIRNQITRSSGSIMDNIAEGFERSGNKEFRQFLSIAKGSCGEVRSQLYRLLDQKFITKEEFELLEQKCSTLNKRIYSFMNYLNKTEISGIKFLKQ
jgi:four helix bundle protein